MNKLYYDFHIHSCLSPCADDDMTPANIAGMAALAGLNAIALTDHNSCKNCEALLYFARQYGLIAIPGMELCTAEEVHVLCYFRNLQDALAFDEYVSSHMLAIKNNPSYFGNQYIYNCHDEISGIEETSLITSTMITFFELPEILRQFRGIMVPAHLDKSSNSLLANLGFIPEDSTFITAELADLAHEKQLKRKHPYLQDCRILCSSDAHRLENIHDARYYLELENFSLTNLFWLLQSKKIP
jgi:hypothetical protein